MIVTAFAIRLLSQLKTNRNILLEQLLTLFSLTLRLSSSIEVHFET